MLGAALVGFRKGTTDLLRRRRLLPEKIRIIFGIPNARMSSYPCFQHFHPVQYLDNFVPGIPNAINSSQRPEKKAVGNADPRLRSQGTPIE
jgi:hypothetical protein